MLQLAGYTAFLSAFLLVFHAFRDRRKRREDGLQDPYLKRPTKVELACQYLRVLGCTALLGLSIAAAFILPDKCGLRTDSGALISWWGRSTHVGLILTFAYTVFLSISATVAALRWNIIFTRHLNGCLFVVLAIYGYRDIYPLVTFNKVPMDLCEGAFLWTKIALLVILAVIIPFCIPRRYVPADPEEPMPHPNPEQTASILSLVLFFFLDPVVFKAYRVPHLPYEELPPLSDSDRAGTLKKWHFPFLDIYSGAKKRSMAWSLLWIFRNEWTQMALAMIVHAFVSMGSPVAVNRLLRYLEPNGKETDIQPWFWILVMFASPVGIAASMEWYLRVSLRTIVQLESLITQLVFEHALRIRVKAEATTAKVSPTKPTSKKSRGGSGGKNLVGRINNLVTTDLSNISELRNWVTLVVSRPLEFLLSAVFLFAILGWSAFVGIGLMILLAPIPGRIINIGRKLFLERMKKTDSRVQIFTDVMNVLRMIKLFGWERKMSSRISLVRDEELRVLTRRKIFLMFSDLVNFVIPLLSVTGTFATYVRRFDMKLSTLVMKQDLTASKVFSSLVVFEKLQRYIRVLFININRMYTAKISMDRITDFLTNTELLDSFSSSSEHDHAQDDVQRDTAACGFRTATFSWTNDIVANGGETSTATRKFFLTVENELFFKPNAINLITGPTGSGKTSMILALLGEMHFIPSGPDSWYNLPREGGVAYAAQESWVQNETIKTNILFSSEYDETRYKKVLYQCALERDLSLFEAGDLTEVGEKGITLSGGQKARLTLARAVYSRAQILLLDDILAALDVHTSRWVVEKCLKGDLVRGRTVILVTHNTALTRPIAEFVVSLKDGCVVTQESITSEAGSADFDGNVELADQEIDASVPSDNKHGSDGKLVVAEEIQEGHIGLPAMKLYALGLGGNHVFIFFAAFLISILLASFTNIFQTWYLGYWASQYETRDPGEVPVSLYLGGYVGIVSLTVAINCFTTLVYIYGTIRASESIHRQLVDSVFGATMRWLDKTPVSRIITRSTQDINSVDNIIPSQLRNFVDVSVRLVMRLGAVILFSPLFIIPGIIVLLLGSWCGSVYFKAQMSVKREMSVAKAPVLGHFGATISGLTSIRAYGAQNSFMREMQARTDRHTRIARVFNNLQRWMAMRVNTLSAIFTASLAWYLVYYLKKSASETGFSLNMAVTFSMSIFSWVLEFNALEARSNSLERIEHYLHIEQEPKGTESGRPPAYWPSSGDLLVENLSARYSPDGPEVLHNLSFHVRSGERIGVVGRTGSGKSSLTLSLLRCIFTTGKVFYDGLLTSSINLDELRSRITIIPQAPDLISGTLRENLDPFEEHDDLTLNNALKSAGLVSLQEDVLDESKITLDTAISSGGGNFSMGQRQIIALARAIIRQSKLLILDEATSAIDYKTDSIIQSSLRSQLAGGVTLITIAHRLQTVMDSDRIMVLDAGRIVEFDTPKELLKNSDGYLYNLVENSHDKDVLIDLVYGNQPPY